MNTYLLVWNPERWHWWDEIADSFEVRKGEFLSNWSSGKSKSIVPGDRLFLVRLGKEPRGIVGAGYAISSPYAAGHWDKQLAKKGKKSLYVDVKFESVLHPGREPILTIADLREAGLGSYNWSPRASGVNVPPEIAKRLERIWSAFLSKERKPLVTAEAAAVEGVRTEITGYSRGRNRQLRDLALAESRGICEACRVDFSQLLSGRGVRALQVHHRRQLAATDKPRLTKLRDLAVLCANCHCLVHMNPAKAIPVENLRRLLRGGRSSTRR